MSRDTLRDQLLNLGFKPSSRPGPGDGKKAKMPPRDGRTGKRHGPASAASASPSGRRESKHRYRDDIDLAKAYAIRAQKEKDERIEAERLKQEQARQRREAKARLAESLQGQALNDPNAEIARHFTYGGKIKRIYVNPEQLRQLNAGQLGVVQLDGRYLLVSAQALARAEALFAPAIALKVDPDTPGDMEDPDADPRFQVPDDLIW